MDEISVAATVNAESSTSNAGNPASTARSGHRSASSYSIIAGETTLYDGTRFYVAHLKRIVDELLNVGLDRINSTQPLSEYGLDSISSVVLLRKMEESLPTTALPVGVSIPNLSIDMLAQYIGHQQALSIQDGLERAENLYNDEKHSVIAPSPSCHSIRVIQPSYAHQSLDQNALATSERYDTRAIRCIKPASEPAARLLIFYCFGFGEESYRWVNKLPNDIEVWTVGSTHISKWDELIKVFAQELRKLFDKPVIAWGHSMGAIAAFEVLAYLERKFAVFAKAAILSSAAAPLAFSRTKYTAPFYEINAAMSDQEVERRLTDNHLIIPRSAGVPLISPSGLRNDIELIKSFRFVAEKKLAAPLYLVQANNDVIVSEASVVACWESNATQQCRYEEIEGTHLFFMNPPPRFIKLLIEACKEMPKSKDVATLDGVYELKKMTVGTEDRHLFPFGSDPCGYIIYAAEGQMAAHIWHRNRRASNQYPSPAEALFTYTSYAADYRYRSATVDHDVVVCITPGTEGKTLRRYLSARAGGIDISTSPIVMQGAKQEGFSGYQQLSWDRVPVEVTRTATQATGCWVLTSVISETDGLLQSPCKGQCIVTSDGFVSILISAMDREEFAFKNPALATDAELQLAMDTAFSWLARLDGAPDATNVTTLAYQAPYEIDETSISVEQLQDKLRICWRARSLAAGVSVVQSEWSRKCEK